MRNTLNRIHVYNTNRADIRTVKFEAEKELAAVRFQLRETQTQDMHGPAANNSSSVSLEEKFQTEVDKVVMSERERARKEVQVELEMERKRIAVMQVLYPYMCLYIYTYKFTCILRHRSENIHIQDTGKDSVLIYLRICMYVCMYKYVWHSVGIFWQSSTSNWK
jgi:hypothetical protein